MASDEAYAIIKRAIATKTNVGAHYRGHYRELSPHVIGMKRGRPQALCLQIGGGSNSGLSIRPEDNWRCLPIEELRDTRPIEGRWRTASNYSLQQSCVEEVDLAAA